MVNLVTHYLSIPIHLNPLHKPEFYKDLFTVIYAKQWKTPISLNEYQQRVDGKLF